jgi:hypothetical protein
MSSRLFPSILARRSVARRPFSTSALFRADTPKVDPKVARKPYNPADAFKEENTRWPSRQSPVWFVIFVVILAGSTVAEAIKKAEGDNNKKKKDKKDRKEGGSHPLWMNDA